MKPTPVKFTLLLLAAAAGVLSPVSATTLVYNLNFNGGVGGTYLPNYTGTGAAPGSGNYWNQIQETQNGIGNYSATISNLTASDGVTSSGIDVLVEYSRAYNDGGASGNNLLGSWFQADGSINGGGVARVFISGLAAGSYDLYTYGINGGFTGRGTRFIINNNNWTGGTPDGPSYNWLQTTGASASSFENGVNYVVFNGAAPFGGNSFMEFYIGANPVGLWAPEAINDQGPFNGLQLALLINDYWAPGVGGGGTGTWSTGGANWAVTAGTQGNGTQSTNTTLLFGNTAGTVTVSGGVNAAAGMTFSTDGYTVTNSTITLTGGNAASNTITTAASVGATVSSQLAGSGGMTKAGAGTLTFGGSAANTLTGTTTVSAGTLQLNKSASTTAIAGNLEVATGATLLISQSEQVNDASAVTLSGGTIIRGAGVSEVFGSLNLTAASSLDFGTGATGSMTFGTYEENATPSALLTLSNFMPGNSFTFSNALFAADGSNIGSYFSFGTGYINSSIIDNGGSSFTITAIPEPSTVLAALGLTGLMLWPARRRMFRVATGTRAAS